MKMIREDTAWAMDVSLSCNRESVQERGVLPLLWTHHFVRIIHEARRAVARFSRQTKAIDPYPDVTARIRHSSKLLDDTKSTPAEISTDLTHTLTAHKQHYDSELRWRFLSPLQCDTGLYFWNDRLLGNTITMAWMMDAGFGNPPTIGGHPILDVTGAWGRQLSVLNQESNASALKAPSIDFSQLDFSHADVHLNRYLGARFPGVLSLEMKLVVLWIQGELNTLEMLIPLTASSHEMATLRASVITAYHCMNGLRKVADSRDTSSSFAQAIGRVLDDSAIVAVMSDSGRAVRNRCMHYPIYNINVRLNSQLPMDGIVEAVYPGLSFADYHASLIAAIHSASMFLNSL